ncbi:conserved hypothetical protein [Escherichia coli M605]|uniref:Phage-related membrane protein n=1 Tax=Escherichia coli M605 TaxID=656417 RepID=F4SZ72_ECOLX|nr:hypothetical protein [Escherichia coli]EGI15954.1 conserved hypothetical protein [Escherichia coli M605]
MNILSEVKNKLILGSSLFLCSALSFADTVQGPDLTSLTSQVHFDSVIAAICTIFGAGVMVSLTWIGGSKVLSALKRMQ